MNVYIRIIFLLFYCLLNSLLSHAQKDVLTYESGKKLFREHCSSCHSAKQEIYGPMLGSITKKRTEPWLISFIQNSQALIKSGDSYAIALFEKFNKQQMPSFETLSEKEIKSILYYLEYQSTHPGEYLNDVAISFNTDSNVVNGKQEFSEHCAVCHFIHTESSFAPALGSVTKRHDRAWIKAFIQNSQQVIRSGDPYAENLYKQFDKHVMTSMDFLSDDEINSILDYIEYASTVDVAYNGKINKDEYKKQAQKEIASTFQPLAVFTVINLVLLLGMLTIVIILLYLILQFKKQYFSD